MLKPIIVNKFGGGILTKEFIPSIKKRLLDQSKKGDQIIAVVSAMPKITDEILDFVKKLKNNYSKELISPFVLSIKEKHIQIILNIILNKEFQTKAMVELNQTMTELENKLLKISVVTNIIEDEIVSYGEKLSAVIFTHYLNSFSLKAKKFLAEEIPIITDNNFKNANIDYDISEKNIRKQLKDINEIVVIPGFTGITKNGEITTLGRGGTDTTACFVGRALKAEKIILWKDVGGILSADPKIVKNAKTIPSINYFEAEEAGKIIHDKAIQYIKNKKIKLEIASILDSKKKTEIGEVKNKKGAKIISVKKDLFLMTITDENLKLNDILIFLSGIFDKYKTEILLISNAKYSVQIVTDNKNDNLEKIIKEIKEKIKKVEIIDTYMIFAIGKFQAKDINDFNELFINLKAKLLISAFYYENCYRMEAIIKTSNINGVVKAVYKKFIR